MRFTGQAALTAALAIQPVTSLLADASDQQIACEVSYVNFAWGFQHSGVYIDPRGAVGEFRYSADDSRWVPNRGQPMTQSDLRNKYRPGNRIIGKVCSDQMVWLRDELNKVRYSPVSKPEHASSDGGIQYTQCWMFESEREPGQHVRLRESGDLESRNLAETAPALAHWIEAVARDARENAHVPLTSKGCISYPESLHQQYDDTIQQSDEDRDSAMKFLASADGLRCRMGEGRRFDVTGTAFEQRATPENFEMNYFQLDWQAGKGRLADGGRELHEVRARANNIGVVLEDNPLDGQEIRTTTVVPYRMGGQNRFPAVMHEVLYGDSGLTTTTYIGSCTVIPR